MLVFILSILALLVGVGIYPLIKSRPSLISFFDAFVLISVIGLTLMHLIPHSVEGSGIWGVLAVCIGFGIPVMMHKLPHQHANYDGEESKLSQALLMVALIGVITHTLLDGIGLSMGHVDEANHTTHMMLGLGVLFHRLPVGLFLGMMLIPRMGFRRAIGIAVTMAVATVLGFVLGHFALPMASLTLLNVVQGLIAGTLLHVVFHNVSLQGRSESPWFKGAGALLGVITLILIEILMPGHDHSHASVLETWIDYLWRAAPIWCGFAAILGGAYAISRRVSKPSHDHHDHEHHHHHEHAHHQVSLGQKIARWVCRILDPQPVPAVYGNPIHLFSAAGIVILVTLFHLAPGAAWWGLAVIFLGIFKAMHQNLHICDSCRPESLCNQHKSYGLWLASSWTQVACVTLLAAVMPFLFAPLAEWMAHIPATAAYIILSCLCLLGFVGAFKSRGVTPIPCILGMFGAFVIFSEWLYAQVWIGLTGIALVCLYDYHPRDIRDAVDAGTPWLKRYILTVGLCLLVSAGACWIPNTHLISVHPHALAHFAPLEHDHDKILPQTEGNHGNRPHETLSQEAKHSDKPQRVHVHEMKTQSAEHSHALAHPVSMDAHDLAHDHADFLHARLPFLILFMLTGLFWLLRLGPRRLFETALGKHHHDHG